MHFQPSQWASFIVTNIVSRLKGLLPFLKHWSWYAFRRAFLLCTAKYAIDSFWLCFKKRKLGVTYMREISLRNWVAPNFKYEMDSEMRILIRKCGYHYNRSEGHGVGTKVEPWVYGDSRSDTKKILQRMEEKALKHQIRSQEAQAKEMQSVIRVLKNFKDFTMSEAMQFFQASKMMTMEKGDVIFGPEDTIEYYYGVISGQIELYGEGISNKEELIKVADRDDCVVSIIGFLRYFIVGPEKYGSIKIRAVCGSAGKYFRVPIVEIVKYMTSEKKSMYEFLNSMLIRTHKFTVGLNDLTGIIPRLLEMPYLMPTYEQINLAPGIVTDSAIVDTAFVSLEKLLPIPISKEDRRMCWVGVLDSRTVLLRRYKETKHAFYVHKGLLACTVSKLRRSYNAVQFYLSAGEIVGWREALVGIEMAVQYQVADGAKALVVALPNFLIRKYIETRPSLIIGLLKKLLDRHNPILSGQISYSLRFTHKRANEAVFRHADLDRDSETYAYLCLSGRLRFIFERDTFKNEMRQYGIIETGEWFGLISAYADDPLMHRTVICDRYAEYVAMSRYMLSLITRVFNEAAAHQCDYLARNVHRDHEHTFLDTDKMMDTRYQVNSFGAHTWRTFRMICIYPASDDIPAKIFCDELARHHTSAAVVYTREDAMAGLGIQSFNREHEYTLAKWLVAQEETTTIMFLLATNDFSDLWNETVAQLSDMVQVLITYEIDHKPSANENNILQMAAKARKELVFIHPVIRITKPQIGPEKFPYLPKGSILWLRLRPWVHRHHHVRMLDSALRYAKLKDPADLKKYLNDTKEPDKHSDYARIVRWISGQSVGIVLGGGGAKGAAHLGALRYLHELDVPVDYIAGVSIGSFLGALYAVFENIYVVETKAREMWEELKNPIRYARDLQFHPFSSLFRGLSFNWMINYFFGSIQIEDLYIPYFCVTSDLHDNSSRTHMSGELWFYVRASMTLTLLFPPQINQTDYHLLMDGGYSDLVPAMTMRKLGIKYLVAINIGDDRMMSTFNIGYHVSGLKCLIQNLLPFSIENIPNHFDMWDALLYCSARNFIQILKAMDEYCVYIRPNINAYSGLDFQNFEEMKTLGYNSAKFKFGGLKLKNLPVHVIWYLLRFYTYPNIPQSQAQMLQGFTDDDWDFAVTLMSKTQMFQRAKTTFLKMNLTPYLTDLMEARSYLESILEQDELENINLNVPVLENFSRDDERLDLIHAIAKHKEWTYMADIESIMEGKHRGTIRLKPLIHPTQSHTQDLRNVKRGNFVDFLNAEESQVEIERDPNYLKDDYPLHSLLEKDPSFLLASMSYSRLKGAQKRLEEEDNYNGDEGRLTNSEMAFNAFHKHRPKNRQSLPSLHSLISGFITRKADGIPKMPGPSVTGQRLDDFRKMLTTADREKNKGSESEPRHKLGPILTLKQFRKSFNSSAVKEL